MAFNWFSKPKNNPKTLGATLGAEDGVKAELSKMQGAIKKTSRTYQDDIKKYKEIAKFNQHLTKSYVANLKVIVDVSELLNSYSGVFTSMKEEFSKMDSAVGRPLEVSDFEYLENLTRSKMDDLNTEFSKQTDGLKKLYTQYGRADELNRMLVAEGDIQRTIDGATEAMQVLKQTTPSNSSTQTNTSFFNTRSRSSNSNSNSKSKSNSSSNTVVDRRTLNAPSMRNASEQEGGKRTQKQKKPVSKGKATKVVKGKAALKK